MASGGAHPVDPSMSSDNSPDEEETNIALTLDDIRSIQKQLMHYEKIAMSFLFYDDDETSLKMCKDCLKDRNKMVLIGFAKDNPPEVWSMKVLECLFYLKNYFLLNKYGLTEEDAARRFSKNSHILPRRLTLYKICESLTLAETKYVMDSVCSISEEEYLEVFFLKICNQSDWANVYKALSEIDKVEELAKELVFDTRTLLEAIPATEGAASLPPHSDVPPPAGMSTYPIHDPNNVGLCIILNEIDFVRHDKREGSDKDVEALEATMREFNFEIITRKNVYSSFFGMPFHKLIISSLKKTHSIFFLVILSHGTQAGMGPRRPTTSINALEEMY